MSLTNLLKSGAMTLIDKLRTDSSITFYNGGWEIEVDAHRRNATPEERDWHREKLWIQYPEIAVRYAPRSTTFYLKELIHLWVEYQYDGVYQLHWYRGKNYWYTVDPVRRRNEYIEQQLGKTGFEPLTHSEMAEQYAGICRAVYKRARGYMVVTQKGDYK